MDHRTHKYAAVREALHERIRTMQPRDQLPSESQLCQEFGVARATVRRAMDGLVDLGMVTREHGRGVFVASPTPRLYFPEHFTDTLTGFHDQQTMAGNAVSSTMLARGRRVAWRSLSDLLALEPDAEVYEITRLRRVNGVLHHHAAAYVPMDAPGAHLLDGFVEGSLLSYVENAGGTRVGRVDVAVNLDSASTRVADGLGLEVGAPVLAAVSTFIDTDDRPLVASFASFAPQSARLTFGITIGSDQQNQQSSH